MGMFESHKHFAVKKMLHRQKASINTIDDEDEVRNYTEFEIMSIIGYKREDFKYWWFNMDWFMK